MVTPAESGLKSKSISPREDPETVLADTHQIPVTTTTKGGAPLVTSETKQTRALQEEGSQEHTTQTLDDALHTSNLPGTPDRTESSTTT